jgi:hypothetical protein
MALQQNPRAVAHVAARFATLRDALAKRVAAKREFIVARGAQPSFALDPRCLHAVAEDARAAFFRRAEPIHAVRPSIPSLNVSLKLR